MASPQKENGFAPIANEILEAVSKCKFNGTQFRILVIVWRYTYGFSRKEHELSVNFLVEATGITKRQIQKELQSLLDENVLIEVRKASFNSSRVIGFNKDYEKWDCYTSTPKIQQVNETLRGERLDTSRGVQKDTSTGVLLDTQERKIKEIYKEKEEEEKPNPFLFFEQNGFGTISPYINDEFSYWIDGGYFDEPELILIEAMRETLKANTRNLKYTFKCLRDWNTKKLKTLKDVQASNKQYEASKQVRTNSNKKPVRQEKTPEWFEDNPEYYKPKEDKPKEVEGAKESIMDKLKAFRGEA